MASKSKQKPLTAMQRGMSDIISYEDILIAQYMNQIEKSPPTRTQTRDVPVSPYAIATKTGEMSKSKRPKSAVALHQKRKDFESSQALASHDRIHFMAWDEGEFATQTTSKKRPTSASSTRSRSSVFSGTSSVYSRSSSKSLYSQESSTGSRIKRKKPLYKKKPKVICIRAFQNGNRDNFARVTAPDLLQLLDNCTTKLGLVSAARKLFFSDGTLITDARQVEKDADVYVSCGEAFKDPYTTLKEKEELRRSACWTLTGIVLPDNKSQVKTKTTLSKRMQTLVESQKRRILVFRNGESAEGVEIVAGRFDEFLDDCTSKLKLESGARRLFDWEGHEIKGFKDVPVLERILQPSTTTVLGPAWVTRGGETFSPKGAYNFLLTLLSNTKERIRYSKLFKDQLDMQLNHSPGVQSKEVMSMTDDELQTEIQQVEEHITELSSVVPTLKKQIKQLQESVDIEGGTETHKYQHISQINPESRLLGKQGLRLKVFENGRHDGEVVVYFNLAEAEKGIQGNKSQLMHRFLDTCTSSQRVGDGTGGPAGRRIAQRVFLKDGKEVTNVHDLEYDQEIWLSYGEDFRPLNVMVLQLALDKASCMSLWDEMEMVQREVLLDEDKGDRPAAWRAVTGFPPSNKRQLINLEMLGPKRLEYAQGLQKSRVDEKGCFLQSKEKNNLVLYPDISMEVKKKKGAKDVWPADAQEWVISQGGLIFSKAMPQLALAKSEHAVQVTFSDNTVAGCCVQLAKRSKSDPNQQWGFSPTGQIYSLAKPSFFLTYVAGHEVTMVNVKECNHPEQPPPQSQEEENEVETSLANLQFLDINESNGENEDHADKDEQMAEDVNADTSNKEDGTAPPSLADLKTEYGGKSNVVVLLPRLSGRAGLQRWAVKQEDLGSIGQWKHTTVANPEWNKRALSWPVTEDGNWNTDFSWPMEGFLLPFAPPVKKPSDKKTALQGSAIRLRVMKNGDSDRTRMAVVVGPDLTNMWHDVGDMNTSSKIKRRSLDKTTSDSSVAVYESDACHPLDCRKIELELFLDQCTQALGLPFAGRRLFDEEGRSVTSLSNLSRDQLVYVSCGENWIDPQMSYSEQQRRALLMNLASDIARIRQYCVLRDPSDLVLNVDGPILPGSRIVVDTCVLSSSEKEKLIKKLNDDNDDDQAEDEDAMNPSELLSYAVTAHERAHQRAEERLKSLRWSWENDKTSVGDQDPEKPDEGDFTNEITFSDPVLQKKFVRQALKTGDAKQASDPTLRQRWHYSDGFIHLKKNPQLVLGLADGVNEGTSSNEVVLCKKNLEDPSQRWIISEDGTISLRSNVQLILTVTTPPLGNDPFSYDKALDHGYLGSAVIVATRKTFANGNCHQLWSFNRLTGFVEAFASDTTNKEITAANKSNVCTYAVLGQREIYQPGYAYMLGTTREKLLCEACGKASRGKNKLQRLKDSRKFACVTGTNAEDGNGKLSSCFKCLSSKVDLSTLEAESTLDLWEYQLNRLRNEGNVRTITKELNVAKSAPAVRILAYRNGEGSRGQGVLVIGSSLHSLLDQSTARLGLTQAARRLYTVRGELITDIHQLVRPYNASMVRSLQETEEAVVAEELQTKPKKKESPRSIPNGDALDYIQAENKQYYNSNDSREDVHNLDLRDLQDDEKKEEESSGNTYRLGQGRKRRSLPTVLQDPSGFPRWDTRWPIDVWISCGEPFIPLEEADKQYLLSMKHREERTWIQAYLDMEKHVLRHIQGRRFTQSSPPQSPSNDQTRKAEHKVETIKELKMHLLDVKSRQKSEELPLSKPAKESTQRLYSTPKTVRIKVFPNGESVERAVVVYGASIREILDNSTSRLGLSSAARRMFKQDGTEVLEIADIRRGETFSVSCGDNFIRARDRRHQMEVKATWSRMARCPGGKVLTESGAGNATDKPGQSTNPKLALPAPPSPAAAAFKGQQHPVGQISVHTIQGPSRPFNRKK